MLQQVTPKLVAIKSCSETNSTESITNRFQLDEQGCHRPRRSARQEQTYKFAALASYPHQSNCTLQSDRSPESKPCLTCDGRTKGHQPKSVASLNNKEKHGQPHGSGFALNRGQAPPSSWQAVTTAFKGSSFPVRSKACASKSSAAQRTILAPFQVHALQSLSIPKTTYRFTETRNRAISRQSILVVSQMISDHHLKHNCTTNGPCRQAQHGSHKRLMQRNQWNTGPSLCSRSNKIQQIVIHSFALFCSFVLLKEGALLYPFKIESSFKGSGAFEKLQ